MNKAITDGVLLMPPPFEDGLSVWSSGDGTPGSDSYAGDPAAAIVPADADFGGCLELLKGSAVTKLRYTGETPILPGCYIRVTARVKAVSGSLPTVRIAGWAADAAGSHVPGLDETGPEITLTSYGEVVEVSAIIGTGARRGVDMHWGTSPAYGHFGLDLTGPNGGVVRIDDIRIEDATSVFLRNLIDVVDVRDYGALGDGTTDDSAAFEAADAAADGRTLLVSAGTYRLAQSVTLASRVRFEGELSMPEAAILSLTRSFDLPTYIDAFGGDEEAGFRKAFQSLLNNADHETLDMCGRRVTINAPLDMAAIVASKSAYAQRRVIRNGQLYADGDVAWDTEVVSSQATYFPSAERTLTGVANVANVPVGALVEGDGVGREVYVNAVNVAAGTVTLSQPLYGGAGTQVFTFRRFRYMLDFSGFDQLSKFSLEDMELLCNTVASGVMLARSGVLFRMSRVAVTRPGFRAITSIGEGCQGMQIDGCQFTSRENGEVTQDRVCVVMNTNANDVKIRDNWASQHRHFAVLSGANSLIQGNHFFQGDSVSGGIRTAGLVLADSNCSTTLVGNYVDNCHIEWTNEHDAVPDFSGGFGFAALTITNNVFLCGDVAPWFSFIVAKPFGSGHALKGLNVQGNTFRAVGTVIDRVERVDTSFADMEYNGFRDIHFSGNAFNNVSIGAKNPLTVVHEENTPASTWVVDCAPFVPFGGRAQKVLSMVVTEVLRNGANVKRYLAGHATPEQGSDGAEIHLGWDEPVRGEVTLVVDMGK
ncbi:right-handed parallel beta-helix repeat-containing protein [Aquicoccus sp. SCR17]|nr:right-handed parallel beta-helix repeat-containing protein [Carideicomes alvinocaridis]